MHRLIIAFLLLCACGFGTPIFGQAVPIRPETPAYSFVSQPSHRSLSASVDLQALQVQEEERAVDLLAYISGKKPLPGFVGLDTAGRSSQIWQNYMFDKEGVPSLERRADIPAWVARGDLVSISDIRHLAVSSRIPKYFRYCRIEVHDFLRDIAQEFYREFKRRLPLTSLLRDVAQQKYMTALVKKGRGRHARWMQRNINASPVSGERASSHFRAAFDVGKASLTKEQCHWLRCHFMVAEIKNWVEVTEEVKTQKCFHVAVFTTYLARSNESTESLHAQPAW